MLGPRLEASVRPSMPVYCACRTCAFSGATKIGVTTGGYIATPDTL